MKVLVIEDDPSLREIICRSLEKERYVTEEAPDFQTALEKTADYTYDCILLDIMLPDGNGLDLLEELKKENKKENIIIISAKDSLEDKVTGLDMGADDYLTKPFGIMELVSRVKALLRRTAPKEQAQVYRCGDVELDDSRHAVTVGGEPCILTYKEYELLKFLLINQDIVVSREKIISHVWGFDYGGESRTVDMHVKTLRQKLGESGALIKTVRNVGYKLGK